jgi:O-antigen ligase
MEYPIVRLLRERLGPTTVILSILCLALVLIITFKDLRISIYIFLLAVAFTASANPVIHMVCYILRWLILVLITARVLLGRARIRFSLVQMLFFLWAAVAIMSAFQAPSFFRGIVFGAVYLLCFFVFFMLVPGEIETAEQMQSWFKMFSFLGWTFALTSFAVFISDPSGYRLGQGRLAGVFANPMILSRTLVFAGTIFLWNGLRQTGRWFRQALYYAMSLFCFFLVFLAGSRGSLGGLAIIWTVFALRYRRKMVILIIPVLVMGVLYIVPLVLMAAPKQFVTHISGFQTPHRPMLRQLGVQLFKERPIRGWGVGSLSDPKGTICPYFISLHNVYLNYLVEFGLPGFLIVMGVFVYTYLRLWRLVLFDARSDYIRDVAWFFIAYLTALFVWNYFETSTGDPAKLYFYWVFIIIAFTECLVRINQQIEYDIDLEYSSEIYRGYEAGEGVLEAQ